jgi:sec-independent protein translocase protein TatA
MLCLSNSFLGLIPGIAGSEWIILIVIIVILLFGAKKLPELAKSIGRATGEFQKGKTEVEKELKAAEETAQDIKQTVTVTTPPTTQTTQSTKPAPAPAGESETERLIRIAKELGIKTEGKTESELKEEITKAMMR